MAKPFVKWAGGKGKLLKTLEQHLPADFSQQEAITYIEPFVGGGAMLFHMLEAHPNINRVIINDINPELMACYTQVKYEPENLLALLEDMQKEFFAIGEDEGRRAYYYGVREEYNKLKLHSTDDIYEQIQKAACFIFLNRTCFNGLYRENHHGAYNVPFGRYTNPTICNREAIMACHEALLHVEIQCGNYQNVMSHVNPEEYNFFYFDPPYRPLLGTSNFKDYTQFEFGDQQQMELRDFCNAVHETGALIMLSNSDSEIEPGKNFFEQIYQEPVFHLRRVNAPRVINAFAAKRVPQSEVLITNYEVHA